MVNYHTICLLMTVTRILPCQPTCLAYVSSYVIATEELSPSLRKTLYCLLSS